MDAVKTSTFAIATKFANGRLLYISARLAYFMSLNIVPIANQSSRKYETWYRFFLQILAIAG